VFRLFVPEEEKVHPPEPPPPPPPEFFDPVSSPTSVTPPKRLQQQQQQQQQQWHWKGLFKTSTKEESGEAWVRATVLRLAQEDRQFREDLA
jgi:hypothetical protein